MADARGRSPPLARLPADTCGNGRWWVAPALTMARTDCQPGLVAVTQQEAVLSPAPQLAGPGEPAGIQPRAFGSGPVLSVTPTDRAEPNLQPCPTSAHRAGGLVREETRQRAGPVSAAEIGQTQRDRGQPRSGPGPGGGPRLVANGVTPGAFVSFSSTAGHHQQTSPAAGKTSSPGRFRASRQGRSTISSPARLHSGRRSSNPGQAVA